jgi:cyclopropane fatty-acyl-phospholipid synthase-like methyltransferase
MSRISFENFGLLAQKSTDYTRIAGRYEYQKAAESLVVQDVLHKLNLNSSDNCLDIGCGTGNILLPLSFFVRSIVGLDNSHVIKAFTKRISIELTNIELISGNFLDVDIGETFDKILVYSVIHYLKSKEEVLEFINKASNLLKPGGKLLVADLPNFSKKKRFKSTTHGKEFEKEWGKITANQSTPKRKNIKLEQDNENVQLDDHLILSILGEMRIKGFNSFLLPQAPELPMGYTREDILIEKLK